MYNTKKIMTISDLTICHNKSSRCLHNVKQYKRECCSSVGAKSDSYRATPPYRLGTPCNSNTAILTF